VSTQFRPIEIPPGVVSKPTKQMQSSNWAEVNLMRWVEGQLSPVGGQTQYGYGFASRCRAIHSWYDLQSRFHIAYLCEAHIYVDTGGSLLDITPAGGMNGPIVAQTGGYGGGNYGADNYGTGSTAAPIIAVAGVPPVYSLDNFGQILLIMTSDDKRLLKWDPGGGPHTGGGTNPADAKAVEVTSSDTGFGFAPNGRCFVVTPERFVIIFGTGNDGTVDGGSFRRFAWCDQENFNAWNFTNITSQAGYLDVEPASPIITAKNTPQGTLFWTATTCYVVAFLGAPYIYNYTEIAKACTPWSPQSVAAATSMTLWMSAQGMFSYNGSWVQPVPCAVRTWIEDNVDPTNVRSQACAVNINTFNEFWWFFPASGQPYNTLCVIYNYKEQWWSMGRMSRSAGVSAAYTVATIMADGTMAYQHELGSSYSPGTPLPWAESYDLNLTSGSRLITIKQLMPDIEGDVGNLLYSLFYRMSRSVSNGAAVVEQQTTPKPVRADGYVDFRTTGRDIRLRIALAGPQVNPVTVGQHLFDGAPRGDR
jgi:hypothetical protein